MDTLYWHDYETFGLDPACDRPAQFAGLRTDLDLNPIGEPLMIYCKPAPDLLPSPKAAEVTGITPQLAEQQGLIEPEFIAAIEREMALPGTCSVGYNSLRFDDEVSRYSLYRNFYDPYGREWQNGNSRWDLIEVARFAWALRPEGVVWPQRDNGLPSLRLEELTAANGLAHEAAHDALSDVTATIAMAKLLKQAQPKLYDYAWQHRGKHKVAEFVDLRQRKPFLHVSGRLSAARGYTALMMPLVQHPSNKNAVICVDLSAPVEPLFELDAAQLRERLYTRSDQLPEGIERLGLKQIQINKCPMVATAALLDEALASRHNIDREECMANWQRLLGGALESKLQAVFDAPRSPRADADQQLYDGFASNRDKALFTAVRAASAEQLASGGVQFEEPRYRQLLFNYRARFYPETLTEAESAQWRQEAAARLSDPALGYRTLAQAYAELGELDLNRASSADLAAQLDSWYRRVAADVGLEGLLPGAS